MRPHKRSSSPHDDLHQFKLEEEDESFDPAARETDADGDDSDFTPESPPHVQVAKRPMFRRVRKYTSCENCITKKIKCNRSSPCSPCVMRNQRCEWIRGKPADPQSSAELTLAFTEITRLRAVVETFSARLLAHGLSTSPLPDSSSAPVPPTASDDLPIPALMSPALSGSQSPSAYGTTASAQSNSGFDFSAPPTPSIATTAGSHSDLSLLLHSSPPLPPSTPTTTQPTLFRGTSYPPYPSFSSSPFLPTPLPKDFVVQPAPPPQHQHSQHQLQQHQQATSFNPQPYFNTAAAQGGGPSPWTLQAFPFLVSGQQQQQQGQGYTQQHQHAWAPPPPGNASGQSSSTK